MQSSQLHGNICKGAYGRHVMASPSIADVSHLGMSGVIDALDEVLCDDNDGNNKQRALQLTYPSLIWLAFWIISTSSFGMDLDLKTLSPERMSATEAAAAIREGSFTVLELVEACLARIDARPEVKPWAYIDRDLILKEARRLDAVPREERKPLHGIPVGIKDIFETRGALPSLLLDSPVS